MLDARADTGALSFGLWLATEGSSMLRITPKELDHLWVQWTTPVDPAGRMISQGFSAALHAEKPGAFEWIVGYENARQNAVLSLEFDATKVAATGLHDAVVGSGLLRQPGKDFAGFADLPDLGPGAVRVVGWAKDGTFGTWWSAPRDQLSPELQRAFEAGMEFRSTLRNPRVTPAG